MLDREACERRVYRLATLLTGDPRAATSVIGQVLDAQPDLRRLDSAHLDRLAVLRSREIPSRALRDAQVPEPAADALGNLSQQQREAWTFARVYQMPQRDLARAMDCSVNAAMLHLRAADQAMTRWLGDKTDQAARDLLNYSLALDVPAIYRIERERRRKVRRTVIIAGITAAILLVIVVLALLTRPRSARAPSTQPAPRFTRP